MHYLHALVGDVRDDVNVLFVKHLLLVFQVRLEFVAEVLLHLNESKTFKMKDKLCERYMLNL